LNVHPSLLPDLRGPAPIEHTILKKRQYTGVSVQTLHPKHFDQGTILAQTPPPGIAVPPGITSQQLEKQLADVGAGMLVRVLESRSFVPPLKDAGWYAQSGCPTDHAPKITKADRFVDFETNTLADVFAKRQALGDLWCLLPNGHRLILHDVIDAGMTDSSDRKSGFFIGPDVKQPLMRLACGGIGILAKSTYEGNKQGHGNLKLARILANGQIPG
jgi:methionyl-tRNA formyltransferase